MALAFGNQGQQGTFWSDAAQLADPKRVGRWIVTIEPGPTREGLTQGFLQFMAKKITKPNFEVTEAEHSYINHNFYFPGRVKWNTIDLTLVDPLNPDSEQWLQSVIRYSGYVFPNGPADGDAGNFVLGKSAAVASMGTLKIQQLSTGPAGSARDIASAKDGDAGGFVGANKHWILKNAWLKDVKFGDLDYTSDDLLEVTCTIRYDWAEYHHDDT